MPKFLIKINLYGSHWLNPAQISQNNKLGYKCTFVSDNINYERLKLWEVEKTNVDINQVLFDFNILNAELYEESAEKFLNYIDQNTVIQRLHAEASKYHTARLDAFGLAAINEAVRQADTPKAKAIQNWSTQLWSDYRNRKDTVQNGSFDGNFDFSNNENLPFGFYDAIDEAEQTINNS